MKKETEVSVQINCPRCGMRYELNMRVCPQCGNVLPPEIVDYGRLKADSAESLKNREEKSGGVTGSGEAEKGETGRGETGGSETGKGRTGRDETDRNETDRNETARGEKTGEELREDRLSEERFDIEKTRKEMGREDKFREGKIKEDKGRGKQSEVRNRRIRARSMKMWGIRTGLAVIALIGFVLLFVFRAYFWDNGSETPGTWQESGSAEENDVPTEDGNGEKGETSSEESGE